MEIASIACFLAKALASAAIPLSQDDFAQLWGLSACAMNAFRDAFSDDDAMVSFIALQFRLMCHYEMLSAERWKNEEKGS